VTIPLSQPGAKDEAGTPAWAESQAASASAAAAIARTRLTAGTLDVAREQPDTRLDILTGMGAASQLADEYDSVMAEVIEVAESCTDEDWHVPCPNEQRTVGVVFDHIATGNPEVVAWIHEFLADRPVVITAELLHARNAEHAQRAEKRPRQDTVKDLKAGSERTSHAIRSLTGDQLQATQEFGWAGKQEVAWVAGAALRHPRNHLKSIREALSR
jgi:hypothetical protein